MDLDTLKIDIRVQVRALIERRRLNLPNLMEILNKNNKKQRTVQSLQGKLSKGTLRYSELLEITDALGYEVIIKDKTGDFKTTLS